MFHSRPCLLNEGAAPRELSPVLGPKRQWRRDGTDSTVSWNKWELARGCGNGPRFLANLEPRLKRYAYPLSAYCPLIACSGVLVTIFIINEMQLDYSAFHAGFAYKTTEQLWHSRALLRCIVCSHHDAVLVAVVRSFRIGVLRQLREIVRAQAEQGGATIRGLCAQQWFGWYEFRFDRRSPVGSRRGWSARQTTGMPVQCSRHHGVS